LKDIAWLSFAIFALPGQTGEPDVDLPEGLAQAVRDMDHNSLPAPGNIHLAAKSQQASSPNVQTKNHRLLHLNRRQ